MGNGDWGLGNGDEGDEGYEGDGKAGELLALSRGKEVIFHSPPCPLPLCLFCPMPNAPCPTPHAQCPIPDT